MSQTVEDMLNGLTCQVCGSWMDDFEEVGHPRTCNDCQERLRKQFPPLAPGQPIKAHRKPKNK